MIWKATLNVSIKANTNNSGVCFMNNDLFSSNWTTDNGGYPLNDANVQRYISVLPSKNQLRLSKHPFYCFIHFGMNTATAREWGSGRETPSDFTIKSIDARQWAKTIKSAGATGLILTCKHHDGFCLWPSKYTDFCVKNSSYDGDIVKEVSDACREEGLDFGVYLSPWDMHESTYGKPEYNDYFCNQLTELLTNYGKIFEVWFDGAKGANAVDFEYDWQRYYDLIRRLQPDALISICGPDVRWVGNEGGKTRESEFSVVPAELADAEKTHEKSQHGEGEAGKLKKQSTDEDLGSRAVLEKCDNLIWYPAEVDVSIRRGWFWSKDENITVKSGKRLFNLYLNSVGKNCTLLLNVPPTAEGVIHKRDVKALEEMGRMIKDLTAHPLCVEHPGELQPNMGYIDFDFSGDKKLSCAVISEDISFSQRVEKFELWVKKSDGKFKKVYDGTVIGSKKIIKLKNIKCVGARLVIKMSRSTPVISEVAFYG